MLACLLFFAAAMPSSTLGLLWPSIRISIDEPIEALGVLLALGTAASVVASAATGRLLSRLATGWVLAAGGMLVALALVIEAGARSVWVFAGGMMLFGAGFAAIDTALNAHAAHHFGARGINWMHASYGVGATAGTALVTVLLSSAYTWRWVYGSMGLVMVAVATVLAVRHRAWIRPAPPADPVPHQVGGTPERVAANGRRPRTTAVVLGSLAFTAIETGIESGAGIWGYVFLTQGRGLSPATAGAAVAAYWAMMVAGRGALGAVAERLGAARVLGAAVAAVSAGAALMAVPGHPVVAVTGLMVLGLAAAPVFPLFTLTTAQRLGPAGAAATTRTVGLQVAASAIGSAALPAGIGWAIGAYGATAFAPPLLLLSLAMWAGYAPLSRSSGRQ